ncbi:MAG: 5'/3'-nucleotidase SurE [Chloroflexi bacterium]|nr:5'/3'-nucleotidase SurE [Chloroflexota bacterium]
MTRPLILLVNDDGIDSPGLAAAAAALDPLGELLIVAPRVQQSGMGRSFPTFNDGRISPATISANGQTWPAYAGTVSPAQAVLYGVLELAERKPALVVSGINYGENVSTGITASGTVGAALEAAMHDIPALAVSLQVHFSMHFTNDASVDFSAATHFTRLFAERWLHAGRLPDVDVLKLDIPASATPRTPWQVTPLAHGLYFRPLAPERANLDDEGRIRYELNATLPLDEGSDARAVQDGVVAVTPLSVDLTSRVPLDHVHAALDGQTPYTAPAKEPMMLGVNVVIMRDGKVLLTKREDFHVWCLPGGHVDPGESLAEAACREVREETGYATRLTRLVGTYSRPRWKSGYHIVSFAGEITGGTPDPDPHEVVEMGFFDPDDLPPLVLGHRQRILDAVQGAAGLVVTENISYPPDMPYTYQDLYAVRDQSGLARDEFYRRFFSVQESTPPVQVELAGTDGD